MRRFFASLLAAVLAVTAFGAPAQAADIYVPVDQYPIPYAVVHSKGLDSGDTPIVGENVGVQLLSSSTWAGYQAPEIIVDWFVETENGRELVALEPDPVYSYQWTIPESLLGKRIQARASAILEGYEFESIELKTSSGAEWLDPIIYPAANESLEGQITITGPAANDSRYILTGSTLTFSLDEAVPEGFIQQCRWYGDDDDSRTPALDLGDCTLPLTLSSDHVGLEIFTYGKVTRSDTKDAHFRAHTNLEVRYPSVGFHIDYSLPKKLQIGESANISFEFTNSGDVPAENLSFHSTIGRKGSLGQGFSSKQFSIFFNSTYDLGVEQHLAVTVYSSNYDSWTESQSIGVPQKGQFSGVTPPEITAGRRIVYVETVPQKAGTLDACAWRDCTYTWKVDGRAVQTSLEPKALEISPAQFGSVITLEVAISEPGFETLTVESQPLVFPREELSMTGVPTIVGTAKVGNKLSAKIGAWNYSGSTTSYQWYLNDTPISGATSSTLTLVERYADERVHVKVTGRHPFFTDGSADSDSVAVAEGTLTLVEKPKIAGSAVVGVTLKAVGGKWSPAVVGLDYQWFADGVEIRQASFTPSLTLTPDLVGKQITLRMIAAKGGYASSYSDSAPISVAKSKATVSGKLSVSSVKKGKSAKVAVKVRVPGTSKPVGTVKVTIGKKSFSKKVTASAKGKVTVSVKGLAVGKKQAVKVKFVPSGSTAKFSKSSAVTVVGKLTVKK